MRRARSLALIGESELGAAVVWVVAASASAAAEAGAAITVTPTAACARRTPCRVRLRLIFGTSLWIFRPGAYGVSCRAREKSRRWRTGSSLRSRAARSSGGRPIRPVQPEARTAGIGFPVRPAPGGNDSADRIDRSTLAVLGTGLCETRHIVQESLDGPWGPSERPGRLLPAPGARQRPHACGGVRSV